MVRAALEAEDEAEPLPFVGSLRHKGTVKTTEGTDSLHQVLGDLDVRRYYNQRNPEDAFALLRSQAEAAGVFVILKGDLGSYHTAIGVDAFRGFAIADNIAPFVVINDNDAIPAWSFTLLHELVHLLLGLTGISGDPYTANKIERFCNNIASRWMLPAPTLSQIKIGTDLVEQQQTISKFARPRNLSHTMVAYCLLRAKHIDQRTYTRLSTTFRERWRDERDLQRTRRRESEGGVDYYIVRRHRVGQALLRFTSRMVKSEALSITKAARVLDVKPGQVSKLLPHTG